MRLNKRQYRGLIIGTFMVGVILILDQLYLFGIPFGGFLGDVSQYDPTRNPEIHHWMLGVALLFISGYLYSIRRRV